MKNAARDLMEFLHDGEVVEAVVFGPWGWGGAPSPGEQWEPGYMEPTPPPVPFDKRGVVLTFDEATPMMEGWSFDGGFGAPKCYAVRVWTNLRVIWASQYDGSTWLNSAARNPSPFMPDMPGG